MTSAGMVEEVRTPKKMMMRESEDTRLTRLLREA
jgi:hypothetical protein